MRELENRLREQDIHKIVDTFTQQIEVEKFARLVPMAEIEANDFNLNIPRYVDTFEEEQEIDLMAVRAEREQLKAQLAELETEMARYLEELGYGA